MNMVNSDHILNGIKRFASDFKSVLEAPDLPAPSILAAKHRQLQRSSTQNLQETVSPYLQNLVSSETSDEYSSPFNDLLSSGEYLQKMSHEEMVIILMLNYLKKSIRGQPPSWTHALTFYCTCVPGIRAWRPAPSTMGVPGNIGNYRVAIAYPFPNGYKITKQHLTYN